MSHDVERFDLARPLDLQVAVLRCQRSALLHGASDLERSVIATIVSELGSNVLKYGRRGTLEVRRVRSGLAADIEVTAQDAGPGIADVDLALTDRYSSSRTLGLGLPGVRRMADELDIDTSPERGTVVRARKRLQRALDERAGAAGRPLDAPARRLEASGLRWSVGGSVRTRPGQRHAGDAVCAYERGRDLVLAVVDASGHGPVAHALAVDLAERLRASVAGSASAELDVTALLAALHEACVGTVGAAAGIAVLDADTGTMRYLAVGNVRAAVVGARRFTGVSRDGVLGRRWPTPFVQVTQLAPDDHLLLWTDGLPEALARTVADEGGRLGALGERGPADAAEALVARHAKLHDDAACLVARWLG